MKKQTPTPKIQASSGSFNINSKVIAIILLLITAAIYANVIKNDFCYFDDNDYVVNNQSVHNPNLELFKKSFVFEYTPLTTLSYAADTLIFGEEAWGYHFTNLLLHLVNTLLVLIFFYQISKQKYVAGLVALLFAIHPLHVESVAWIAERKDLLYTLFFMLSLICYWQYLAASNKKWFYYTASIICFLFSLFSKPQAVCLPFILYLLDYWKGRKIIAFKEKQYAVWIEKIPFILLSGIFSYIALQIAAPMFKFPVLHNSIGYRLLYMCYAIYIYLVKTVIPYQLAMVYPYPEQLTTVYFIAPIVLLALVVLFFVFFRKNKHLIFGSLFFIFCLLPVLQIKQVGVAVLAERYTYLSTLGLFFIAADWLIEQKNNLIKGALVVYMVVLCYLTNQRVHEWGNSLQNMISSDNNYPSIFVEDAIAFWYGQQQKGDSALIYTNKCLAQRKLPRFYFAKAHYVGNDLASGLKLLDTAISMDNQYAEAYLMKGVIYKMMQNDSLRFYNLQKGLSLQPNGSGYVEIADYYEQHHDTLRAIKNYELAFKTDSTITEAKQRAEELKKHH